jgi:hypothetical protein
MASLVNAELAAYKEGKSTKTLEEIADMVEKIRCRYCPRWGSWIENNLCMYCAQRSEYLKSTDPAFAGHRAIIQGNRDMVPKMEKTWRQEFIKMHKKKS